MTVTLPETLQYGKVVGRFVLAVADVPEDPDPLPNAVPAVGTITFTAATPLTKEYSATPPTTVVRSVIQAALDNNGYLYNPKDPTGSRGIWLVAGPYKVAYSLNTGAIAGHDILVLPEHDDETPLDLISALPPGGPILTASQYAELTARMETLEAEVVYGASAYDLAVEQGYSGTEAEWLASLKGDPGDDSTVPGPPGLSAYQVAVNEGFIGDEVEWLASLEGTDGNPGLSAYQVAVSEGFVGDEAAWLASLEGQPGDDSTVPGPPGLSAYQVAVNEGFVGDEAAWLASLEGADGADGDWSSPQALNTKTGPYTLVAGDAGTTIWMDLTANADLTVPANVFTAGQTVEVIDEGAAGRTTFVAGEGMDLRGTPSLISRAQNSGFAIRFKSATRATVIGDLA